MSSLLKTIREPRDLRTLTIRQLATLAREIRETLISHVSRNGGHLGPNLGVVELTIALHRVFESPHDRIIFDVGHQAYVHKLLTGRQDFTLLRKRGGLSGYPSRAESGHDIVENQHASTSLSWADGIARATEITGEGGAVVAVIGDGALTGGMAWEALNNIAAAQDRPVVIVVNDNGHSYQPTVGAFAGYLAKLRTAREYEQTLQLTRSALSGLPVIGEPVFSIAYRAKKAIKDIVAPQHMFEDLGLKYIGPVDGHDQAALERALRSAKSFAGPVIVHCITQKGRGYLPAEQADERLHQVGPAAAKPAVADPAAPDTDWTAAFATELVAIGEARPDVVAITAAMTRSTGLEPFAQRFPGRFYDVGIAEQHATTAAAGMATAGLHPVVAIYGTFLNRAFDQIMMDVALHRCAVTFVLPRCGVTGDDGASHNGMWDLAALQVVPGLRIAAPRDTVELQKQLREAVAVSDGPTVVRFPKGSAGAPIPAISRIGGVDVIRAHADPAERADVLMVAMGSCVELACTAAEELTQQGYSVTVVDPRWVKPVDPALPEIAARHRLVVTVEDGVRTAGAGAAVTQAITDAQIWVPVHNFGLPVEFLDHGSRSQVLERVRLTAADVTKQIAVMLTKLEE